MKNNNPRLLLAKLREGDYAHAGDSEAIDLVFNKLEDVVSKNIFNEEKSQNSVKSTVTQALDLGCGLGGTAEYVRKKLNCQMQGIDHDQSAIEYAKTHYPHINFVKEDALNISKIFSTKFDLIFMFNVFYALPDKEKCLQEIAKITKDGGLLIIFDYVQKNINQCDLIDLAGKPMKPMSLQKLEEWFNKTGWETLESVDLTENYKKWYHDFLDKLKFKKTELLQEFTPDAYDKVEFTFSKLIESFKNDNLGGGVIYARKRSQSHTFFSKSDSSNIPKENVTNKLQSKL